METSFSSLSFRKEFLVHLLITNERSFCACTCRYLCNWSLVSCEAATFLSCCLISLDTLSCFDACCRRSCYNYKQKTITFLTILCIFLMKKMQLPKIRNGVFVSCDNDCIHMYGKSALSMSMTYQKPKEGRGYSLQWPIWGG